MTEQASDVIDLSSYSKLELLALRTRIDEAIAEREQAKAAEFWRRLESDAKVEGMTVDEVLSIIKPKPRSRPTNGRAAKPRYRDRTTSRTWAGRGTRPAWVNEAQARNTLEELGPDGNYRPVSAGSE